MIPVLMFACNRVTVAKALDSLLSYRTDPAKFPIIVSQVRIQVLASVGVQICDHSTKPPPN